MSAPTLAANESLDRQQRRLSAPRAAELLPDATRGQDEGQPVQHTRSTTTRCWRRSTGTSRRRTTCPRRTTSTTRRTEPDLRRRRRTGIRRTAPKDRRRSTSLNLNLFSTVTANKLNEFHFTYSREDRPRSATPSSVPADTAMGLRDRRSASATRSSSRRTSTNWSSGSR